MNTDELAENLKELYQHLYDATVYQAEPKFNVSYFPEEYQKYIEKYIEGDCKGNSAKAVIDYLFDNHYLNDNIKR